MQIIDSVHGSAPHDSMHVRVRVRVPSPQVTEHSPHCSQGSGAKYNICTVGCGITKFLRQYLKEQNSFSSAASQSGPEHVRAFTAASPQLFEHEVQGDQ